MKKVLFTLLLLTALESATAMGRPKSLFEMQREIQTKITAKKMGFDTPISATKRFLATKDVEENGLVDLISKVASSILKVFNNFLH